MSRCVLIFVATILFAPIAFAAEPTLASIEAREFKGIEKDISQRSIPLEFRGSALLTEYSSDVPLEILVAFPLSKPDDAFVRMNPLDILTFENLPAGEKIKIEMDLTVSPAWSPWRDQYILYVQGEAGGSVSINDIQVHSPTIFTSIRAAISHLFIDEPQILSSVNFLFGPKVLNVSLVMAMGLVFVLVSIFITQNRNGKWGLTPFLFLLVFLFDARFSLDLVRGTAKDLAQWNLSYEYRQLGPLHIVADFLKGERRSTDDEMLVAMCFDSEDLVHKALRYELFPTPVRRAEDSMENATHLLLLATSKGKYEDGLVTCGDAQRRVATPLAEFPDDTYLYRLLN